MVPSNRKRAVVVGINAYPGAPLKGCVNDAVDVSNWLVNHHGFRTEDVRMLTDTRATKGHMIERLECLVKESRPGDLAYFHFSGHGSQMATRDGHGEVDKLSELVCPHDFAWDDYHAFLDYQFLAIFSGFQPGVRFWWVADCCHSSGLESLSRSIAEMPVETPRTYPIPPDMAWRIRAAEEKGLRPVVEPREMWKMNLGFLSGCMSNQTSADTVVNGRPCGALTHYLIETATQHPDMPLEKLATTLQGLLGKLGYSQRPQAGGNIIQSPLLT